MKNAKKDKKIVGYCRVSTTGQDYGLLGQEQEIRKYATTKGFGILGIYTEHESGKHNTRPELEKAIARAVAEKATLVIATLDRLSRNVAFLMNLRDREGLDFIALDIPDCNTLTIGIMATLAQHERELISKRVKKGLEQARLKGKIGGAKQGCKISKKAITNSKLARKVKAMQDSIQSSNVIRYLIKDGKSIRAIAKALTEMKIKTARGKDKWSAAQVKRVIELHGIK